MDTTQLILLVASNLGSVFGLYQLLGKRITNIENALAGITTTILHYDKSISKNSGALETQERQIANLETKVAVLVEWKRNVEKNGNSK